MSYVNRPSPRDIPILTTGVCIICAIIFVQMQSAQGGAELSRWGLYPEKAIYTGSYWGLITSALVHREPLHLLFNLYWLWILGGAFERSYGAIRWILFFLVTAFVSSGLQLLSGSDGIGLSGVGYAFFGFAWVAKVRNDEFARIVDKRTVELFVGWGILCFVLTEAKVMNIGNYAHLGGLLIGAAIAGSALLPKLRIPSALGAIALTALSVIPLKWNPLSIVWVNMKAYDAMTSHDYTAAIDYLSRSQRMDKSEENLQFADHNLAEIYGFKRQVEPYRKALENLAAVDKEGHDEVVDRYGTPEEMAARQKK